MMIVVILWDREEVQFRIRFIKEVRAKIPDRKYFHFFSLYFRITDTVTTRKTCCSKRYQRMTKF